MYIIQTNTSIIGDKAIDFQSYMYKISKQTWDEFKEYILSKEDFTEKIVYGTMTGSTKPRNFNVLDVLVEDDFHLEIIANYGRENDMKVNSKYYKVTEEQFSNLIRER
jgi:hypothetical protein